MHVFDGFETRGERWRACESSDECEHHSDSTGGRISASLLWKGLQAKHGAGLPLYQNRRAGLILRPSLGIDALACVMAGDGHSQVKNCEPSAQPPADSDGSGSADGSAGCVPGCSTDGSGYCSRAKCLESTEPWEIMGLPWRPSELQSMMRLNEDHPGNANEIVISAQSWNDRLPEIIEAFFLVEGEYFADETRASHAAFLRRYNLTSADVPLLALRVTDWSAPFAQATRR